PVNTRKNTSLLAKRWHELRSKGSSRLDNSDSCRHQHILLRDVSLCQRCRNNDHSTRVPNLGYERTAVRRSVSANLSDTAGGKRACSCCHLADRILSLLCYIRDGERWVSIASSP